MTIEKLQEKINKKFGDVDYEIIYFEGKMTEKFIYKHLDCGKITELKQARSLFNKDIKNFCHNPDCKKRKTNIPNRLPIEIAQKRIDDFNYKHEYEIIPETYVSWGNSKCLVRHLFCGKIFKTEPRRLASDMRSASCPCLRKKSKGEHILHNCLEKYSITFEEQKRFKEMSLAPFDFYLPDYNLLIEFQGRQHFEPVEVFGGQEQLERQKSIDIRKKELAKQLGKELLYISYKEMSLIEEILVQRLSLTGVEPSGSKCQSPQKED